MISRPLQIVLALLLIAVFGMGVYVLETKHRTEQLESRARDQRPVVPPVAGPQAPVILWIASDADSSLHREEIKAALPVEPAERAREILRNVLSRYLGASPAHSLGAGADIKAVYLVSRDLAVIDANTEFAAHHASGVLVESLTVSSLVQTLAANFPQVRRVRFLVDGRPRDTLAGHADLLNTYNVSALAPSTQPRK